MQYFFKAYVNEIWKWIHKKIHHHSGIKFEKSVYLGTIHLGAAFSSNKFPNNVYIFAFGNIYYISLHCT